MSKLIKTKTIFLVMAVFLLPLIISVIKSGYYYTYDWDELTHVQKIYLIGTGFKPYLSFYSSFTPLFHYFLLPIFRVFGFSFETIDIARIVMILLFGIRVLISYVLVEKIFSRRVALLFVPLLLLDPFTVFASMQIRPDNLMMTTYVAGLLLFVLGYLRASKIILFLSGAVFGLSSLILIKMVLIVGVIYVVWFVYCIKKNHLKLFWVFLIGYGLVCGLFVLYFLINGSFFPMFEQVFVLAPLFASSATYYTPFGFFHKPDNVFIYGVMGRPDHWKYAWTLPLIAAAGGYGALVKLPKEGGKRSLIKVILLLSFVVAYVGLLLIKQVFIQYYIPVNWFMAIFAAYLIDELGWGISYPKFLRSFILLIFLTLFVRLTLVSINANNIRSTMRSTDYIARTKKVWSKIPKEAPTFANILFRPLRYPLGLGYEEFRVPFPPQVKALLPKYAAILEKDRVPYLVIDVPNEFFSIETNLKTYVEVNYKQLDDVPSVWKRIE